MKVAIYCRVSTDKQELEQQIQACKKYCENMEYDYKVYSDIGSGKEWFNRPQFNVMLEALRRMEYDGVVVFYFDRLGRDTVEVIKFFDEMESKRIRIISLNESFDTSTAIGRAIRDIIVRLAQLERESISEKTKARLKAMRDAGHKLGRPAGSKDKTPRKKSGYYGNKNNPKKGGRK